MESISNIKLCHNLVVILHNNLYLTIFRIALVHLRNRHHHYLLILLFLECKLKNVKWITIQLLHWCIMELQLQVILQATNHQVTIHLQLLTCSRNKCQQAQTAKCLKRNLHQAQPKKLYGTTLLYSNNSSNRVCNCLRIRHRIKL